MKNKLPPSIFNDVLGPVMRGPSSSHTAAAVRIGRVIKQFFNCTHLKITVEFDQDGSLATTYNNQGTDIGLAAGLLGMNPADENLTESLSLAKIAGINLEFKISSFRAHHRTLSGLKPAKKAEILLNLSSFPREAGCSN